MDNNKPLISICCLSYNHSKFIKQAIKSCWAQKYSNIEIIAVDDGSKDGSVELLNELQKESPVPMTVISQENTGNIPMNINRALSKAKGKYISILSLDDLLLETVFSEKVSFLDNDDNLVFVANSNTQKIDKDGYVLNWNTFDSDLSKITNPTVDDLLELEYNNFHSFFVQGSLFRKNIVDEVGGFNEDMIGDDIVLRIKLALYIKNHSELNFKILNTFACDYRILPESIHCNNVRQLKTVLQVLDKYFPDRKNPERLYTWVFETILESKFSDFIELFEFERMKEPLLKFLDEKNKIFLKYYKYKIFSKISFGRKREHYTKKLIKYENAIKTVNEIRRRFK